MRHRLIETGQHVWHASEICTLGVVRSTLTFPDEPRAHQVTPSPGGRSVQALDAATAAEVVETMAPLFEGSQGFLWRLAAARGTGFGSWDEAFAQARALAHSMPEALQVDLVDAHPRLGARSEALSTMSAREQGPAAATSDDVGGTLARLNAAYESRFGFRYCVFVAGRPLAALVPGFEAALAADRDTELHRALDAVIDIAMARQAARARETGGPAPAGAATSPR